MEINQPAPLSIGFSIAQRSKPTTDASTTNTIHTTFLAV